MVCVRLVFTDSFSYDLSKRASIAGLRNSIAGFITQLHAEIFSTSKNKFFPTVVRLKNRRFVVKIDAFCVTTHLLSRFVPVALGGLA